MENIDGMTRNDLVAELKKLNLKSSGSKAELKLRLIEFFENQNKQNNDLDGDGDNSDDDTNSTKSDDIDEQIRAKERELLDLQAKQKRKKKKGHSGDNDEGNGGSVSGSEKTKNNGNNDDDEASIISEVMDRKQRERFYNITGEKLHGYEQEQYANMNSTSANMTKQRRYDDREYDDGACNSHRSEREQRRYDDRAHGASTLDPSFRERERQNNDERTHGSGAFDSDFRGRKPRQYDDDTYRNEMMSTMRGTFTFADIESALHSFSGEKSQRIDNWLKEFEHTATLFRWNNLQKSLYAKRLLKGAAKAFIRTVDVFEWNEIKQALSIEFGKKISGAEVHKLLQSTKKKSSENFHEYMFRMREIAMKNNIDDESVIGYIIDGIDDDRVNKVILYGALTFDELKLKYDAYEKYKESDKKKEKKDGKHENKKSTTRFEKKKSNADGTLRCFLCGDSHEANSCPTKEKGAKCFRCNVFGHRSNENKCKQADIDKKGLEKEEKPIACLLKTKSLKTATIRGKSSDALIDTGSDINAIRRSVFARLKIQYKSGPQQKFTAAGGASVTAKDFFEEKVTIDGNEFDTIFYVVSDTDIPTDIVIGNDLLFKPEIELSIKSGEMVIKRIEVSTNENEIRTMMCMLIEEENVHESLPPKVKKLIANYEPKKILQPKIELKVELSDETPIYQRPRRYAPVEKAAIDKQVDEWLKAGVIVPGSSDFSFQVVLAKKKDNSDRVCVDLRKLNKRTIKDRFPAPLMEEVLDTLQGAKIFTTIDLKNGFFHVPVEEKSRKYLSFVTHNGQYLFTAAPFGFCNSPPIFHRFIYDTFRDLINQGIMIAYMDDICIVAKDEQQAIERMEIVFKRASDAGLKINWKKCQFLLKRIEFLGHIVEDGTIKPSQAKIADVQKFKEPTTVKQIEQFLGLTGYFRKFIQGYSTIAKPLSDLKRKEVKFVFGKEQKAAFEILKKKLCEDPVLRIYRDDAETQLHTDASKAGFGAILMQKDANDDKFHPVYYMSVKANRYEENMDSFMLEVLAIVKALKKFHSYLIGRKFKIVTDCSAFKDTINKKDVNRKVAGWVMSMQPYDFEVEHRKNQQMTHVDALSRLVASIISKEDNLCIKVKKLQEEDDELKRIESILKQQQQPYNDYSLRNGVIYKYGNGSELLAVPQSMETEVIRSAHENGHFGVKRVEEIVNKQFFIPKIKEKIQQVILNCVPCILSERKQGKSEGFLHSIEKGEAPFDTYHVDHLGPMVATCKQYKYLFVVIDAFTKFVWIYPTKTTNTKEAIDKLKLQQQTFGNPRRIITDRGSAFRSDDFEKYCSEEKIEHVKITTGVPRSNGQVERINRSIIPVLTKLSIDDPTKWYKHVSALQQTLNNAFNRSIATSPFKLFFGVQMKQKIDINIIEALDACFAQQFDKQREEERKRAKDQILKVQSENRKSFNSKRKTPIEYDVDGLVAIKRTQFVSGNKLCEQFYGPYRIIKKKPNERYDVQKVGNHSGPNLTSTCAEYMKRWFSPGSKIVGGRE